MKAMRPGMRRARLWEGLHDSLLLRPVLFVGLGLGLAWLALGVDAFAPDLLPGFLRFGAESARLLYVTLAGALLTVAGLTFWVRSASVSLAASQYSARVVAGFLEDFYQQSMMSIMLGLFAYAVAVYRVLPVGRAEAPHFAVLLGIVLAAGSIVMVMGAIRNAVLLLQPGHLARRITDATNARIRTFGRRRRTRVAAATREHPEVPATGGQPIRARRSGHVQAIDAAAILDAVPPDALVLLRVRVGLYVLERRPVARVWARGRVDRTALLDGIVLGRRRMLALDAEFGLQQLVDIAVGALGKHRDVGSAVEVLQHIEMVLRELGQADLPDVQQVNDEGARLVQERVFTFAEYVSLAFSRFRRAARAHPTVLRAMVTSLALLAEDLDDLGWHDRANVVRAQVPLVVATAEASPELVSGDIEGLQERASRVLDSAPVGRHGAG